MKKYLLFLVAAVSAIAAWAADGDTFVYEGLNFKVISEEDHSVAVARNEAAAGDISIPSYAVNGSSRYFVTEIERAAFSVCLDLTSVTIPNSVTAIGTNAFSGCLKLTSITIPNSVTAIGKEAFDFCDKLTSINIPSSVTTIGEGGLGHCSGLTEITVENGNPNYSSENGVLFNVDKTTLIQYPAAKKGAYSIPNSVTAIGTKAFYFGRLTSVTIPNSVIAIEPQAFHGCRIASITIPNSVTTIGTEAFKSCSSMTEIIVEDGNPNYSSENGVLFNVNKTTLIQCPGGKTEEYSIPNSVTAIEAFAFDDCRSLTSVVIPKSVTTIGKYAFSSCSKLTSVTIPDSITAIESSTFSYCSSLTSVTIPDSVVEIGSHAFSGCNALTSVTFPNSVVEIGSYAFSNCRSLTSVTIPNSVTAIEMSAFSNCSSLTSVSIPHSIDKIESYVFSGCSSLVTVTIPASVSKIRKKAFEKCKNLKTIYDLNPTPQTIEEDTFYEVPEDVVIYIPTGSFNKYFVAEGWTQFTDFREMGAGVDDVLDDVDASVNVFNLKGVTVLRNASAAELESLPAGLYIVRQGNNVKKIAVK